MACSSGCSTGCTGGCSGCSGSCSTFCWESCEGTCREGCSGGCGEECSGCTGCRGSCQGDCTETCDGSCDNRCSGCSGCGSACRSNCSACTGACKGSCDNGCETTSMAALYNSLGTNIVINAIIRASDVNDIVDAVNIELSRRSYTGMSDKVNVDDPILLNTRDNLRTDLETMLYDGSDNPAQVFNSADEFQKYINYIKYLYSQDLKD